jgi:hypothetical protein
MATLVLFVAMLYVPSFLQTVQHKSAFEAGLYVIPLLVGLFVQVALLAGQNAIEYRHLGIATGALNFFKSIGGAILAHGLASGDLVHAYRTVFVWTVPFMAAALILAVTMREKPLSEY